MTGRPVVRHAELRELLVLLEKLPDLLYETRRQRGVSRAELGRVLGMSHKTIANFEAGLGVRTETLYGVLRWLGDVEVEYQR